MKESWRDRVDLAKIDDETRYRVLDYVLAKIGSYRELGYDRTYIYRLRTRKLKVSDSFFRKLLDFLSEEEFTRLVGSERKLEALGILKNGVLDYSLVLEILNYALKDKYLLNLIAKWFYENVAHQIPRVVAVKKEHVEKFEKILATRAKKTRVDRLRYLLKALDDLDWELTPEKLEEYILELYEESPHAARHTACTLKLFIKTVLKDSTLYNSFKVPKTPEKLVARALTLDDIVEVASEIEHEGARAFFILLAETGLRPSEVYSLTLGQVDLDSRTIIIGKISETKRSFLTFLHKTTADYLKEVYMPFREEFIKKYEPCVKNLPDFDLAAWKTKFFPFKEWVLRKEIYGAMDKVGRRFRLYDLRAFFSAYMTKRKVSPLVVNILQGRLPPREFKILQSRYLPFTEEDLREIYERNAPCVSKYL